MVLLLRLVIDHEKLNLMTNANLQNESNSNNNNNAYVSRQGIGNSNPIRALLLLLVLAYILKYYQLVN